MKCVPFTDNQILCMKAHLLYVSVEFLFSPFVFEVVAESEVVPQETTFVIKNRSGILNDFIFGYFPPREVGPCYFGNLICKAVIEY